jgi:hypothetical protein
MQDAATSPPEPTAEDLFDGPPIPLTVTRPLPPFPAEAFPPAIATMILETANATQTDPAMAGTAALAVLSACTGGLVWLEVRQGWREPLNVYTAPVAMPGERKSAVQNAMTRPLLAAERIMVDKVMATLVEDMTRKQVAEQAAEKAKRTAANAHGDPTADKLLSDAISAAEYAESIEIPELPRIVADDVTAEALGTLMVQQGGRLSIISTEGGFFDTIGGRYSGGVPNLDLLLKAHAGDEAHVDRKGRPPEYLPAPALTLCLMIQPAVLAAIASNRQFRGRGLLARFLYAFPTSKVGYREIGAAPADQKTVDAYEKVVTDLAVGLSDREEPAVLTLSELATKAMLSIEADAEIDLREDGELRPLADWGSKYVGAVARIVGILHMALHGHSKGPRTKVSAETVLTAQRLGDYYRAAAIKAFSDMGSDEVTADAVYLLDRILALHTDKLTGRDMFNATRGRFRKVKDLEPALERLIEHSYLAAIQVELPTGPGRRPSPLFKVHPDAAQTA